VEVDFLVLMILQSVEDVEKKYHKKVMMNILVAADTVIKSVKQFFYDPMKVKI
jgi:hypothetical protein